MLVNAALYPGPAFWQGVMLCMMPLYFWGAIYKEGKYLVHASWAYLLLGVVLFLAIVCFDLLRSNT